MTAINQYKDGPALPFHPSQRFEAVTPSDSTNFTDLPIGIYVGVGGNVVAVNRNGATCTFSNVPGGTLLPIRPVRINSTSTTATNMVALF